jgi:hypothetical protein
MRSTLVLALSVICAALVLSGPTDAQAVKVDEVTGTIDVSNLPLDELSNVLVSGILEHNLRTTRFVGITSAVFPKFGSDHFFAFGRACDSEFPNTHMCGDTELLQAIPTPDITGRAMIWADSATTSFPVLLCAMPDGIISCGVVSEIQIPVACCGF